MIDIGAVAADLAPTGTLRTCINLGNLVMAQGTPPRPTGVTVDIARELAARLRVPVEFVCFDAARKSYEAVVSGRADVCFLAIEPARAAEIAFTSPYVVIDGVFAVEGSSPIRAVADVDRAGVRIGVKLGSAYDLYLSRTLRHATVVRGDDGVEVFQASNLDVAAGIRQSMTDFVAMRPDLRLLDGPFMQIRQALGTSRSKRPETLALLRDLIVELREDGFVAESLRRAQQSPSLVAPSE